MGCSRVYRGVQLWLCACQRVSVKATCTSSFQAWLDMSTFTAVLMPRPLSWLAMQTLQYYL